MPRRSLALLASAALAVGACSDSEDGSTSTTLGVEADAEQRSSVPRAAPDPAAPVDQVVRGSNAAAFALLRQVATGANTVLGPVSISTALAMVAGGADEPTRATLDQVFGFPAGELLAAAQNTLADALAPDPFDGAPVVELANRAWVQDGQEVGQGFLDQLAAYYGAGVSSVDFGNGPGTAELINAWIADRTRDRITELIGPAGLDPATRLALVNAVYFQANWADEFAPEETAPGPFTTADGTAVTVDLMHQQLPASYLLDEDAAAVEVPYVGGEYAMTIVVPDDLASFLASADGESLRTIRGSLTPGDVVLTMPTWEADTSADLGPALTAAGLPVPGGNFPEIFDGATIGAVLHGANITVDELGTEAAAATVVAMVTSGPAPGAPPVEITVDRPFLYSITHVPTGLVLFLGTVTNPAA